MVSLKKHFINGSWIESSGTSFTSTNPATEEIIWEGNEAGKEIVDAAVTSAHTAFSSWSQQDISKRIEKIEAFRNILMQEKENLAKTISSENGKPLWESLNEVGAMIGKIAISIDAYHVRCRETKQQQPAGTLITRHRPHGVMAVFGPFNFPGHLPNGHIIPALLAGNTIVFKPSEMTPLTAELTVKYWEKSGIPKGVINLIQGGAKTGAALSEHPEIDGILFTGSSTTGCRLAEIMGKTPGKIVALEMGGNNPLIVNNISDAEAAAYLTIQSAFLSSGQRCTCARRLIILQGNQGDRFLKELVEMTKKLVVGPYTQTPEPFMGPLISKQAAAKILDTQRKLQSLGGTPILPLTQLDLGAAFLSPGIIDVTQVVDLPDEEYFGPLLQVIRVADFNAAIAQANKTRFGLTAGLLSDKRDEFELFYKSAKAGVVSWNTQMTGASSLAPFGGLGCSGNQRPSGYYAADYCVYPLVSLESPKIIIPSVKAPGMSNG